MSQLKDIYTNQFIIDFSLNVTNIYSKFNHEGFGESILIILPGNRREITQTSLTLV